MTLRIIALLVKNVMFKPVLKVFNKKSCPLKAGFLLDAVLN